MQQRQQFSERILVIEDDRALCELVSSLLDVEGYRTATASDGTDAVDRIVKERPDAVVLDVMLPGFDGVEVCRRVQADRPVPVLMLTARDAEEDVLVGLGVGADDYLTKPFRARELVARVKALLRRVERAAEAVGEAPLRTGALEIDPAARLVRRDGEPVRLTPIEFDLLHRLARSPGVVLSRDRLLSEVWGYQSDAGSRTVDSHVAALRRKLGGGYVRTAHGVGYAFDPETAA